MFKTIQEFFDSNIGSPSNDETPTERKLQLATAALLIEMSRADFEIAPEEIRAIEDALQAGFGISKYETQELVALAEAQVNQSVSLYEFTRLIDKSFTPDQKKHIVGLLWSVAYSDNRLEENEEYLVRKIAKLLHVSHADFIDEKIRAKNASEG